MPIIDNIEKLHKKPDSVKRLILFAIVFIAMFIIVFVWISTLKVASGEREGKKDSQISSPISVFFGIVKESVNASVDGVANSIGKLKQDYEPNQGEQDNQ